MAMPALSTPVARSAPLTAVYPGSFDPVTLGHMDIAARAARDCDVLVVAVGRNAGKTPLFGVSERVAMLREALAPQPNVVVESFDGAVARYARGRGSGMLVRGVRGWRDRIHETIMMVVNFFLGWGLPTAFYQAAPEFAGVSSARARQRAQAGLSTDAYVPRGVARALEQACVRAALMPAPETLRSPEGVRSPGRRRISGPA